MSEHQQMTDAYRAWLNRYLSPERDAQLIALARAVRTLRDSPNTMEAGYQDTADADMLLDILHKAGWELAKVPAPC